jgi:hypothetical protein
VGIEDSRSNSPAPKKRKGTATTSTKATKRAKPSPEIPDPSVNEPQDIFIGDLNSLDTLGEGRDSPTFNIGTDKNTKAGKHLVHKLYVVHMLFKKQSTDPNVFSLRLVETARAISSVIATIPINYDRLAVGNTRGMTTPQTSNKSELQVIVQASACAFTALMVGLKKIADGVGFHLPSLVVFECVKMFKTIFDSISESARRIAHTRLSRQPKSINNGTLASSIAKDSGPFRVLAQLLNALIAGLNKNDRHHREIFEGMLCILIGRIGDLLYYYTFNQHRSPSIEEEIRAPPVQEEKSGIEKQQTEELAIQFEARCLMVVLERAIGLAPHYMNTPLPLGSMVNTIRKPSNHVRTSTPKKLQTASKAPLGAQAMEKLQRTLVSCMFGDEDCDEFSDVLRMPAMLGPIPLIPNVENEDVSEWFSGKVWRLVGWGFLGRQN